MTAEPDMVRPDSRAGTLPLLPVLTLFFISGLSALIYQVVWSRLLGLLFGNTIQAASTVLAAFMAGLALGSWLLGRVADRHPGRLLRVYGLLELGIAVAGLAVLLGLRPLDHLHHILYMKTGGFGLPNVLWRFVLAFGALIVPTSLMGGTLPVLSRWAIRSEGEIGNKIGLLYSINTLGAVIGAFLTGYALVAALGMNLSQGLAVLLNIIVGSVAITVDAVRRKRDSGAVEPPPSEAVEPPGLDSAPRSYAALALTVQGFCAISLEVLWTRALVFYLGNSVYAFSAMLTTFLFGIGAGSLVYARLAKRIRYGWRLLGWMQVGIALTSFLALSEVGWLFFEIAKIWSVFGDTHWANPTGIKFLKSAMIMLPPTLMMGFSFPLAARLYTRSTDTTGSSVGRIYSLNTLAAIFGSLITGFFLIPLIGISATMIALAVVETGAGLLLFIRAGHKPPAWLAAGVAAVLMALGLTGVAQVRFLNPMVERDPALFYREGRDATVRVFEDDQGLRHISINGWPVAGTGTPANMGYPEIQKMLGHIPALIQGGPKSCLVVGFGSGGTTWALSLYHPDTLQVVELVDAVIDAAPYFDATNHGVLNKPFVNVVLDDGRHYVAVNPRKWDVIAVDSVDPKFSGNGNLYSREFFEACKNRLTDNGVLAVWLPYFQLSPDANRMLARTFVSVFPNATLWFTRYATYTLLIGSVNPPRIDYDHLASLLANDAIAADLADLYVSGPADILECFAMDGATLKAYGGTGPLNTYDDPRVEFFKTRWSGPEYKYKNLTDMEALIQPPWIGLEITGLTPARKEELRNRHAVFGHIINALRYFTLQEKQKRHGELVKAYLEDRNHRGVQYLLGVSPLQQGDKKLYAYSLLNLGVSLMNLDRLDESISVLDKSAAEDPDNPVVWGKMTEAEGKAENWAGAIAPARKLRELNPGDPIARFNLGITFFKTDELDSARQELNQALQLRPSFSAVGAWLKLIDLRQDRKMDPVDRALNIANVYVMLGDIKSARRWGKIALEKDPNNPHAKSLLEQTAGIE